MKKYVALLFGCLIFFPLYGAEQLDEIMEKFARSLYFPNLSGSVRVEMISQKGDVREIEAKAFQKIVSQDQLNVLFLFDYPPTVRDTGLLLHNYFDGRENNMWIYLPAVRRIKRVALEQSGGGYFMGSDFTYADFLMKPHVGYSRELLGEVEIDGHPCYAVKDWADDREKRQESGYSYMVNYYSKSDYYLHARDYYDLSENLLKTYRVEEILQNGTSVYPTRIVMHNVQSDHKSILEFFDYSTEEVSDSIFTTRYLRNRR